MALAEPAAGGSELRATSLSADLFEAAAIIGWGLRISLGLRR
jgi:hypothetical protein